MKTYVAALLLMLTFKATGADAVGAPFTCLVMNGRGWRIMNELSKGAYLRGVFEGTIRAVGQDSKNYFPENFAISEISTAVDQFYSQPENTLIPIVAALQVVTMKFSGTESSKIDGLTSTERRLSAKCPEHTGKDDSIRRDEVQQLLRP